MDQVSLTREKTVDGIGEIPSDLRHPQPIACPCNTADFYSSCREVNEEQHDEACQTFAGPNLDREEIGRDDLSPMSTKELFPCRLSISLRRRFDAIPFQNVCDCRSCDEVA